PQEQECSRHRRCTLHGQKERGRPAGQVEFRSQLSRGRGLRPQAESRDGTQEHHSSHSQRRTTQELSTRRGSGNRQILLGPQTSYSRSARAIYSGSMICPSIAKLPLTEGASVPGCPPPTDTVYLPCATMISPLSVTMLRSRLSR